MTLLLVGLLVVIGGFIITTYNQFQTLKTRIQASIQEIGNQLKRQANLIPNLSKSAKKYLEHEQTIFDKLTAARKTINQAVQQNDTEKLEQGQKQIQEALGALRVVLEDNPEIQGSDVIERLMGELRDTSDKIMYARRTLIDLTADYNRKLATIPSNLVGQLFGFKPEKGLSVPQEGGFLEVSKEEAKSPEVDL
jgi:LemA protein